MYALFGWGRVLLRVSGISAATPPLTAALGLAVVIALGGLINLVHLVHPVSLWLVVGLGIAAAIALRGPRVSGVKALSIGGYVASGFVMLLVAATLVPAITFNYRDDFQKYFVHPIRMLQTGCVQGSSVSAIGFETLGGQAWLHTFVVNLAAPEMLNAVDLAIALPLSIAIVATAPAASRVERFGRSLAALAVVVINPQVVNISATFTACALGAAVLLLPSAHVEPTSEVRPAAAYGCLLAALAALKTSLVVFAAMLFVVSVIAVFTRTGERSVALRWAAVCMSAASICLAPWLVSHASSFLAALAAPQAIPAPQPAEPYSVDLFSNDVTADYGYGDGFAPYTALLAVTIVIAAWAARASARDSERRGLGLLALNAALGAAVLYVLMAYVVGPAAQGAVTSLRLFVPMLLAVVPCTLIFAASTAAFSTARAQIVGAALVVAALVPFAPSFAQRSMQAIAEGSILAFPKLASAPWYVKYNEHVLHGAMRQQVAAAQAVVPPGAPLIAWINAPFWLDFRRNEVHDLELAGLETPWAEVPTAAYVIWEHNGVATPQLRDYVAQSTESAALQARIGAAGLRLAHAMIDLTRKSQVLYDDKHILVLRTEPNALQSRFRR